MSGPSMTGRAIFTASSAAVYLLLPFWSQLFQLHTPFEAPTNELDSALVGKPFLKEFFHSNILYNHIELLAALLLVGVFAAILAWALTFAERSKTARVVCYATFAVLLFYALNTLRFLLMTHLGIHVDAAWIKSIGSVGLVLLVATGLLLLAVLVRSRRRLLSLAQLLLLILSPIAAVYLINGIYATYLLWPSGSDNPFVFHNELAPYQVTESPRENRVLLVLFDGWGYQRTFVDRPAGIELPEIDRLRREAFFATDGRIAGGGSTLASVSSMMTGRKVESVLLERGVEITLKFAGEDRYQPYPVTGSLFAQTRMAGFNNAYAGVNYLPHCRDQFPAYLSWCFGGGYAQPMSHRTLLTGAANVFEVLVNYLPIVGQRVPVYFTSYELPGQTAESLRSAMHYVRHSQGLFDHAIAHRNDFLSKRSLFYLETVHKTLEAVQNPNNHLVFAHLNAPHPPFMYDSRIDAFSDAPDLTAEDNLELVDRTIGILRDRLTELNLWDDMHIVFTADHSWWNSSFYEARDEIGRRLAHLAPPALAKELEREKKRREEAAEAGLRWDVPLLIKLKGATVGSEYAPPLDTIELNRLIPALLAGSITEPIALENFFSKQPATAASSGD